MYLGSDKKTEKLGCRQKRREKRIVQTPNVDHELSLHKYFVHVFSDRWRKATFTSKNFSMQMGRERQRDIERERQRQRIWAINKKVIWSSQ